MVGRRIGRLVAATVRLGIRFLNGQLTSPKGNRGPELDAQSLFEALGWRTYVGLVIAQSSVLYYSDGAALRLKGTIAATEVAAQLCFFQLR